MSDPLMTTEQAAEFCGLTARALEALRRRGKGPPFVTLHQGICYRLSEVEEFVWSCGVETADSCKQGEGRTRPRRHEMPTDDAMAEKGPFDLYRALDELTAPTHREPKVVQHEKTVTYFLLDKATNAIKIGRTTKLRQRIANLDNGPIERVLLAAFRGDHERTLHEMFGAHRLRVNREWFAKCDAIEAFLSDPPGKYRSLKMAE